jgi:hypothetical protein
MKRDEQVAPERELAVGGGRAVGDSVAGLDPVALGDQRPLVRCSCPGSTAGTW